MNKQLTNDESSTFKEEKIEVNPYQSPMGDESSGVLKENEGILTKKTLIVLGTIILTIMMIFVITLTSLLYPTNQKVSGKWESKTSESMDLAIADGYMVLNVGSLSLPQSMKISFEGTLKANGMNSYKLVDLSSFVTIKKADISQEELAEIRSSKDVYVVDSEGPKVLRLQYTKAGLSHLLGSDSGERYFTFLREGVWFGEEPLLYLNNSKLSEERMLFKKVK